MIIKRINRLVFGIGLSAISFTTFAAPASLESHATMKEVAVAHLSEIIGQNYQGKIDISAGRLDPRLRLSACSEPLLASLSAGAKPLNATSIRVECTAPKPWRAYVPVQVKLLIPLLVASKPLQPDHIIRASDIQMLDYNQNRIGDKYFQNPELLIGKIVKRYVRTGMPVLANFVDSPDVIKRGQAVKIIATIGGLQVDMNGVALSNGSEGEKIRVKNRSSKRVIEGIVTKTGNIRVRL